MDSCIHCFIFTTFTCFERMNLYTATFTNHGLSPHRPLFLFIHSQYSTEHHTERVLFLSSCKYLYLIKTLAFSQGQNTFSDLQANHAHCVQAQQARTMTSMVRPFPQNPTQVPNRVQIAPTSPSSHGSKSSVSFCVQHHPFTSFIVMYKINNSVREVFKQVFKNMQMHYYGSYCNLSVINANLNNSNKL